MFNNTKIRYQNPNFRRKLEKARGYKRSIKKIPDSALGIFLARIGLASWLSKIIIFLLLLFALYLIFAPNFLTIKNIDILGANEPARSEIYAAVKKFFSSKPFWPQGNLLLLSKSNLGDYLILNSSKVYKISNIEKDFPATLKIKLEERYAKFVLKSPNSLYVIANDGQVVKQLSLENLSATDTLYSALVTINLLEDRPFYEKQRIADMDYFESLNEILSLAQNELRSPIASFEVENFEQSNIQAYSQQGFVIKLDINSDLKKIFSQLALLLKEVGDGKISEVKYFDMRIKDKGYVCYKQTPCATEASQPSEATSTLNN